MPLLVVKFIHESKNSSYERNWMLRIFNFKILTVNKTIYLSFFPKGILYHHEIPRRQIVLLGFLQTLLNTGQRGPQMILLELAHMPAIKNHLLIPHLGVGLLTAKVCSFQSCEILHAVSITYKFNHLCDFGSLTQIKITPKECRSPVSPLGMK